MKSYKCVFLSLMLLLSTPLSTFCMLGSGGPSDFDDGVNFVPLSRSSSSSMISASSSLVGAGLTEDPIPALEDADDDGNSSVYYTPRSSIQYTGFEDFDKRSVDDLSKDSAYQALLEELNSTSNAPTPTSNPVTAQMVMGAGAVGVLANAITSATPAIRAIRIDDTRSLVVTATEVVFSLFKKCGAELGLAIALGVLIAETRKTVHVEEENKRLARQVGTMHDAIQRLTGVNRKHELVERGLVATEHTLLGNIHQYLCEEAQLIAKGSAPTQAVATLAAILKKNKGITKTVVNAMADLEKIHTDAATLLKDEKQYSAMDPRGWFAALRGLCHKHSGTPDDAATAAGGGGASSAQ